MGASSPATRIRYVAASRIVRILSASQGQGELMLLFALRGVNVVEFIESAPE